MLTDVTIGTNTRGVLKHHTLFAMFLGDDVDHTSDGIATIEGRGCTLHNLYLLDVVRINQRQVVLTAIITMQSSAVYQNQHIRVAQSVHLQMGTHIVLAKFKAGG